MKPHEARPASSVRQLAWISAGLDEEIARYLHQSTVPVVLVARHYQSAERAPSLTLDTDPAAPPPAVVGVAAPSAHS